MSTSQRPGKEVATSSHRKRTRSGNVPLAPIIPKGQTRSRWFGVKAVTKEGNAWYKKHTYISYFSDVCIDRDSLACEFPQILMRIRELGIKFIFAEPEKCNLHMVREFYANWAPKARSHYVTVIGRNVSITPTCINDILVLVDIIRINGLDTEFGPTLTTVERHHNDELIMARMYCLEMLRHQNGCQASTDMQLGEVERRYPLNDHAKALLGIGPEFREPIDIDISIDEENVRTSSDVESDSDEEVDLDQASDKAVGGDVMED
ncbi:hypothetical protein H5410_060270 [Solanum commersonii]|uniref:Uncharacterized protein n=1 Tax=Solanum commersonii TaxID=4109 RepID=A0A9J5W5J3_SOLCO|nr:hypothetical protein H5410_060270 [Solanum commersonii]